MSLVLIVIVFLYLSINYYCLSPAINATAFSNTLLSYLQIFMRQTLDPTVVELSTDPAPFIISKFF